MSWMAIGVGHTQVNQNRRSASWLGGCLALTPDPPNGSEGTCR
jgi:hypothetical protein